MDDTANSKKTGLKLQSFSGIIRNPERIPSSSPGLRSYPGSTGPKFINPERVASIPHVSLVKFDFARGYNPFRVDEWGGGCPGVAAVRQRRAD
jgi:hypothetical protein